MALRRGGAVQEKRAVPGVLPLRGGVMLYGVVLGWCIAYP